MVHRDLEPENVFLTSDGQVKVLDFGLARVTCEISPEAETVSVPPEGTRPWTVLGTIGYMAPEQVRGKPVDHRSDIFALGCVVYEMLSGKPAFARDTAPETMTAILKEEPEDLTASDVKLPSELPGTVRRCLEKRPESRFQSASDLAYTLRAISSGSGPSVVEPAPPTRWSRQRLAAWIAIGMVSGIAKNTCISSEFYHSGGTNPRSVVMSRIDQLLGR